MKVAYDPDRDGLGILFSDAPLQRSTDDVSGLILDYDSHGAVVGLELEDAAQRMLNPRTVEFPEHKAIGRPSEEYGDGIF